MAAIIGSPILPSGAGASAAPLLASFTGGDTQQNGLAAVASSVSASGGEAPYTYAATLTDPRGVDRSAILTGGTSASPGFTPDQAPGGGQWVLRSTVTDAGGQTAIAVKVVTVGQNVGTGAPFVQVLNIVSDGTTDATPSAGSIVWGGVTFAAPNAGVAVDDGDLVLTPKANTDLSRSSASKRDAALVSASLSSLAGLTEVGARQVLIVLDVESYAPTGFNEALRVGVEQAANPLGSGSNGRGIASGQAFVTSTVRTASTIWQSDSGSDTSQTAAAAIIAGVAIVFAGGAARTYTKTTAYADAAAVLADTLKHESAARGSATVPTYNQVVIAAPRPVALDGASLCRIQGLSIWVR